MENPKISIIVPTYGRAEGLKKLFDSIRTFTPQGAYEITVVSSDPVETDKAAWLRQQTDVKVVFAGVRKPWQLRKKSNYYFLNLAIKNSTYPWIFPLSDDMEVESDWYNESCKVIADSANANTGLIIAASHIGSVKNAVSYGMRVDVIGKTKKGTGPWKDLYLSDVSIVRRDVMERVGLFDEKMDWFGSGLDLSLSVEILTDTYTVVAENIKVNHAISRENRGNNMADAFTDFHYLRQKWDRICRERNCQYIWDPGIPEYTAMNRIKNYLSQHKKILRYYMKLATKR